MKRTIALILIFALAATLCSCGTSEQEPEETRIDNYTYEQEKNIENAIKGEMSQYGFNYSIFAHENSHALGRREQNLAVAAKIMQPQRQNVHYLWYLSPDSIFCAR